MFNDEEGKRKMALSISHYAYRNTSLEDYHSECVTMDMEFYKKIYKIVYTKLKNVKLLQKYIDNFNGKLENGEDLLKLLKTVPEELHFKFMRYLQNILFGTMFGLNWDTAQIVDCNLDCESLAKYVLSGRFIENCKNNTILDDKTMCDINKDIHNRIYTLLVNGYFI